MRIASLGSGSRGNATLIQHQDTTLLVDNGFSLRQFTHRLERLELSPEAIDAVLLTHEHSDHSGGIIKLCMRYAIPLWTAVGTARAVLSSDFEYHPLVAGKSILVGSIQVMPVTVPHDANEPLQFIFSPPDNSSRLGLLTDTGHITTHIVEAFDKLDGLLLEFNYDPDMLERGPYPEPLKQRVGGRHGHLSNVQSMELLSRIDTSQLRHLVAAHISEKNNHPSIVTELIKQIEDLPEPVIAGQDAGFDWIDIA